jgi:hypothetical protein
VAWVILSNDGMCVLINIVIMWRSISCMHFFPLYFHFISIKHFLGKNVTLLFGHPLYNDSCFLEYESVWLHKSYGGNHALPDVSVHI